MDELTDYLHKCSPKNIIIGKPDCNLLILGDKSKKPIQIKMVLLTLGRDQISSKTYLKLKTDYQQDQIFNSLYSHGEKIAKLVKVPFAVVVYKKYPSDILENCDVDKMTFLALQDIQSVGQSPAHIYTSKELAGFIYKLIGTGYADQGTAKPENKHIADAFHAWSRAKLSSHLVKQDFDAIYYWKNHYIMIEIKRSPSISLKDWRPFRDDSRNYDMEFHLSEDLQAVFYTFHYNGGNCADSTEIGCYKIKNVDLDAGTDWIEYEKKIIKAGDLLGEMQKNFP